MFIKERRDGSIKEKILADGRSQQEYITKTDVCSMTVSIEDMISML